MLVLIVPIMSGLTLSRGESEMKFALNVINNNLISVFSQKSYTIESFLLVTWMYVLCGSATKAYKSVPEKYWGHLDKSDFLPPEYWSSWFPNLFLSGWI